MQTLQKDAVIKQDFFLSLQPFLWAALLLPLYGVRFEVNDDAIISCILSGAYGADTTHLCYVNIVLAWFFRPFYHFFPSLNWYTLFLEGLNLLCLCLLCRWFLRRLGNGLGSAGFAAFMLLGGFNALQSLQYTKTAGLAMLAAYLEFLYSFEKKKPLRYALSVFLMVLSFCLRKESFFAVGVLFVPLFFLQWLRQNGRPEKLRSAGALALALVLCAGLYSVDFWVYQADPEWAYYRQYNAVRTEISDYRFQFVGLENAEEFGLSTADYYMFETWDLGDPSLYSLEDLTALSTALPHRTFKNAIRETLLTLPAYLLTGESSDPLSNHIGWLPLIVTLAWLCFGRWKQAKGIAFTWLFLCGLSFCLIWQGRLPYRVRWILFCAAAFFILEIWKPKPALNLPWSSYVFALCILAVSCFSSYAQGYTSSCEWRANHTAQTDAVYDEMSADKDHLYLLSVGQLDAIHGKNVWQSRPKDYFSNISFLGGWLSQSPLYRDTAARYGLGDNLLADAVDNEKVYVVDFANISDKTAVLQQRLGLTVQADIVDDTHPNWTVYQLRSVSK